MEVGASLAPYVFLNLAAPSTVYSVQLRAPETSLFSVDRLAVSITNGTSTAFCGRNQTMISTSSASSGTVTKGMSFAGYPITLLCPAMPGVTQIRLQRDGFLSEELEVDEITITSGLTPTCRQLNQQAPASWVGCMMPNFVHD